MDEIENEARRLRRRWYHDGERTDLRHEAVAVIRALQLGEKDWESYLRELPFVDEVENGRDLRGLDFSSIKGVPGLKYDRDGFLDLSFADLHNADLSYANLYRIHLENANLYSCNLSYANLLNTHLQDAILEFVNFEGAHLEKIDLRGFDLSSVKNLHQAYLAKLRLNDTIISRFQFRQDDGRYRIKTEIVAEKTLKEARRDKAKLPEAIRLYEEARISYLALRNNFGSIGSHRGESWAEYREKEMERKILSLRLKNREFRGLTRIQKAFELFGYNFFNQLFMYGENPWRLIWWALCMILVCAFLYPFFGIISAETGGWLSYSGSNSAYELLRVFASALYLSAVSFTTVGYGDLVPAGGWGKLIAGFEGFAGLLFLGLFVWALARVLSTR